ncbi:MAG: hypothetical protein QXF15_03625 [Candidatus Aenigmatarchaeota archaeon]
MGMLLQVQFSVPASAAVGTRIAGTIYNLGQNPTLALASINLTGKKIVKAYVPASPNTANLAMFIINPNGNVQVLGTETQLTMTTTFNPNVIKNILCETSGDYAFSAVTTATAGSSATTVNLMVELE